MAVPGIDDLAEVLASAAELVVAITEALQAPGSRLCSLAVEVLESDAIRLQECSSLLTAPAPSNVRQAVGALSQGLQAANKALKETLLAPYHDPELPFTVQLLQQMAGILLHRWVELSRDPELSFHALAAAELILDFGTLAKEKWPSGIRKNFHSGALAAALTSLSEMRTISEEHKRFLAVLRATSFSPEAILACLRRLLPGRGGSGVDCGEIDCTATAVFLIYKSYSYFEAEQAALDRDIQLQAAIVASLDGSITCFARLSGTAPIDTTAFLTACNAIIILTSPPLLAPMRQRASSNPTRLISVLATCFDLIMEWQPPEDRLLKIKRQHAISCWSLAVASACVADRSGRPPMVKYVLGCIQRGATAVDAVLQQAGADSYLDDSLLEKVQSFALNGLFRIMCQVQPLYPGVDLQVVLDAMGSTNAAHDALFVSLLTALESITRVAALASRWQPRHFGTEDLKGVLLTAYQWTTELMMLVASLCWQTGRPLMNAVAAQDALLAGAGMVESIQKFALIMLQSEDSPPTKFQLQLFSFLALICECLADRMAPAVLEGAVDASTIKRWQAVALAASSAAVALVGSGTQILPIELGQSHFMLLPLTLLPWPGVNNLLRMVPEGRPAVQQALSGLSGGGQSTRDAVTAYYVAKVQEVLGNCDTHGGSEAALGLAQLGALTQLASWGELQSGKPLSEDGVHLLAALRSLVERAVHSCDAAEVQAAYRRVNGRVDLRCAAYWRRLRAEVIEPLEAALGAEAVAVQDPAQVAVDVAEVLATRTCAHVGCTTVVGASEAAAPCGKRCSGCRLVRYCGVACQKADWRAHKAACRELRRRNAGSG